MSLPVTDLHAVVLHLPNHPRQPRRPALACQLHVQGHIDVRACIGMRIHRLRGHSHVVDLNALVRCCPCSGIALCLSAGVLCRILYVMDVDAKLTGNVGSACFGLCCIGVGGFGIMAARRVRVRCARCHQCDMPVVALHGVQWHSYVLRAARALVAIVGSDAASAQDVRPYRQQRNSNCRQHRICCAQPRGSVAHRRCVGRRACVGPCRVSSCCCWCVALLLHCC